MVASVLRSGDVAIVSYETDLHTTPPPTSTVSPDALRFVLLKPIGSGTQIFFTDKLWNGTSFAADSAGEDTFTYTAGADLPAGTVITITGAQLAAAGITLSNAGETIYVYQGRVDAPAQVPVRRRRRRRKLDLQRQPGGDRPDQRHQRRRGRVRQRDLCRHAHRHRRDQSRRHQQQHAVVRQPKSTTIPAPPISPR